MKGVMSSADPPTCTEHSKEAGGTMVSAGRRRREGRKECNDSSSGHLGRDNPDFSHASLMVDVGAHHPKFAAYLVRDPTKDEHANDGARESYASQCFAVIIMFDCIGI
jgi:hypothetical protein